MTEILSGSSGRADVQPALAPGTGRAVLVGFVLVGAFCGGAALLFGVSPGAALVLAAFTGFWGGPGFGGMMGFVLHESRSSDSGASQAPRPGH